MRNINCRKLQTIFLFISFYGLNCEDIQATRSKVQDSVIGSTYDVFQTLIEMSNYFERFPVNESYFETQFLSKNNSTTIPAQFHERLSSFLEYYNVGADCRTAILELQKGLEQQVDWALRMVDAFGKPTSGLVDLGLQWLGSYEECTAAPFFLHQLLEITTYGLLGDNYTKSEDYGVISQYCRAALPLPLSLVPQSSSYMVHESAPPTVQLGVCFPDKCSETDVSRVINAVADHVQGSDSQMSAVVQCEKKKDISTGAVVMVVILGLFGAMLMIGTGYDVLFMRMKLFSKSDYLGVYQDEPVELNEMDYNGTTSEVNGSLRVNKAQNEASNKPEIEKIGSAVDESRRQEIRRKEPESNLHILLMAFSIIKNGETVLNTDTAGRRTNAIEGLRALTMGWVILIHTYTFTVYQSDNHDVYAEEKKLDWTFQPLNSPFAVETFFVISGCLVTYLSLITLSKIGGLRNFPWGKFYILRIWRLSPTYYFAFFIYWFLVPLLSSGPFWFSSDFFVSDCQNTWWSTLLYVNNFYGARAYGCYGISWYLAADTQCYILSPIIFALLYWKPKIGITVSLATMAASCIYSGVVTKLIDFTSTGFVALTTDAEINWVGLIHFYPFSHFAPYVAGMLTGYLLFKNKTAAILKITTRWQIIGWCVSMILIIGAFYIPAIASAMPGYSKSFSPLSAIYAGLSKLCWGLAVGWIIYACATGYGGFINTFLSWGPFIVLGRLTFSTYLVHVIVLHVIYWPRRTLYHLTDVELGYTTAAAIALSFGLGFVLSVCVEQTFFALQKLLLKEKRTL